MSNEKLLALRIEMWDLLCAATRSHWPVKEIESIARDHNIVKDELYRRGVRW